MTFTRVRFRRGDWDIKLPLYDGRECPECRAVVCGPRARKAHEAWHRKSDPPGPELVIDAEGEDRWDG